MEALWPDDPNPNALANRFRVTLASLRKQLEPPGFPFGSVIDTSVSECISLRKGATTCDVADFETLYAQKNFHAAAELLHSPLLPGIYDEWISEHQTRFNILIGELADIRATREAETPQSSALANSNNSLSGLPSFLTEYIPNQSVLSQIAVILKSNRLLTITGTAGIGKTRLSIEAARMSEVNSLFVPLSDCATIDEFYEAILKALGTGTQNPKSAGEQLLDALQNSGPILIILDNIDHLVDQTSEILSVALAQNPQLTCITTSRQTLEIPGEVAFRLETLPIPADYPAAVTELINYPATALFLSRINQSRPDFRPRESDIPLIVEICARLQGLPLALELAAAQIATLSLSEILSHLSQNLVELKSRQRTLSPKHRSLRAALQSSFDDLSPELLKFLGQLACFWGGFSHLAAQEVTANSNTKSHISELVHRSLINAQIDIQPTRFYFLESVRQIAQEQLSPDQLELIIESHRNYFLRKASEVDEDAMETLEPHDLDKLNINAAFHNPNPNNELYWKARIGAISHANLRGNYIIGMRHIRESQIHLKSIPNHLLKRDWIVSSLQIFPYVNLFEEAEQYLNQLREISVEAIDLKAEFEYRINLGLIRSRQGFFIEGINLHESALQLANETKEISWIQSAVAHLSGSLHSFARTLEANDPERAKALLRAKDLANQLAQTVCPASRRYPLAFLLLAVAEYYLGDFSYAKLNFQIAFDSAIALQRQTIQTYCTYFMSKIASHQGDDSLAEAYWLEFSDLKKQTGFNLTGNIWNRKNT
ncbi:hypothetical protein C0431_09235 [bacterium]|nr:hypothetical protein [bacterium]